MTPTMRLFLAFVLFLVAAFAEAISGPWFAGVILTGYAAAWAAAGGCP